MEFAESEMQGLLADTSKTIEGDIHWIEDEDHSPALEFRAVVSSGAGYPLFLRGSFNSFARTLSFAIIHASSRRIYALDLGKDHHNPTCQNTGEKHKHQWSDQYRDKAAYVPDDITEPATNPVGVWQQFCKEANIQHNGVMHPPPPQQMEMFL